MRHLILLACLTACHPMVSMGYDAASSTRGALAQARTINVARDESGVTPAESVGHNYSLGVGFGARDFTIEGQLHGTDLSSASFSQPAVGQPHLMQTSLGMGFRFSWLRVKGISSNIQLAPARTLLLDTSSGVRSWGYGVRFGGGLGLTVKAATLFVDFYREVVQFDDGPALGVSTMDGVTVGLRIGT